MFISAFGWMVAPVMFTHFFIMLAFAYGFAPQITFRQVEFNNRIRQFNRYEHFFFLMLVSIVLIFAFFNNNKRIPSRYYNIVRFSEFTLIFFQLLDYFL